MRCSALYPHLHSLPLSRQQLLCRRLWLFTCFRTKWTTLLPDYIHRDLSCSCVELFLMLDSLLLVTTHLDENCFQLRATVTVLCYDFVVAYVLLEESIIDLLFVLLFSLLFINDILKFTAHNISNRFLICMPGYNRPM